MSQVLAASPSARRPPLDRYLAVTLIATPANIVLYALALTLTDWPATVANLAVATLVSAPSFVACKRWVWADRGAVSMRREVVPYWLSTVLNVVLATLLVRVLASTDMPRWILAVVPTGVYAVTWLARFVLLDRLVFDRT